ncbi:MAG: DUF1223 domain-containing protein [Granulosicoccus sp.]|nr:DUF1223 domain-containing protein [Granulosicoccus sp.]
MSRNYSATRLQAVPVSHGQFSLLLFTFLILLMAYQPVRADQSSSKPVSVVELFTSHGCSSCPPADEYLASLIAQDDSLVALEFHVDYWNQLVHGAAGNWVDPFSSREFTDRQRAYNARPLDGRPGVYTPQIVVNGQYAAVGSDRRRINRFLDKAKAPAQIALQVEPQEDKQLTVQVKHLEKSRTRLWLVVYDLHERTDITAGENKNVTIDNHHIVKSMTQIGKTLTGDAGLTQQLSVNVNLADGEGCSILAQAVLTGPVQGAVNCPRS